MPAGDRFRHQVYTSAPPAAVYDVLQAVAGPGVGSEEFLRRMRAVGDRFRAAGVSAVYLVHGTFVGADAAGFGTELSRALPGLGDKIRQLNKKWIDVAVGDHGNYSRQFAQLFEDSINEGPGERIPVRLFTWSSENHHIGRADAAVRLLDELDRLPNPERILLWGHSHGGNVFALLTNLLAGDEETIDLFFEAARVYFRQPLMRRVDLPLWQEVWQRLKRPEGPLANSKCDFVTFGTPIRYGWDSNGYSSLLHFINHRPFENVPEYLSQFPPSATDVINAVDGDYVQQLGIAGTNVLPGILAWRTLLADLRLNRLLQPGLRARDLYDRLKLGMRVPEEGTTLLADYGPPQGHIAQHHAGHAVYTQTDWLLFHAEQTSAFLYGSNDGADLPGNG